MGRTEGIRPTTFHAESMGDNHVANQLVAACNEVGNARVGPTQRINNCSTCYLVKYGHYEQQTLVTSHNFNKTLHIFSETKPREQECTLIEEGNKMYYIGLYLVLRLGYMSVYEKTVSHTQGYRHFLKSRFTKSAESGSLELHGNNTHPSLQQMYSADNALVKCQLNRTFPGTKLFLHLSDHPNDDTAHAHTHTEKLA